MKVVLATLTPVHIGTGNQHDTLYYHIGRSGASKEDICYYLNVPRIIGGLDPSQRQAFSRWVDEMSIQLANSDNRKSSDARKKFTLAVFFGDRLRMAEEKYFKVLTNEENVFYKATVKSKQGNRYLIMENVKTPAKNLYIPGSSLKGAIRTALGINMMRNMEESARRRLSREVLDKIKELPAKRIGRAEEIIDEAVFNSGTAGIKRQYFDLMKFISISDPVMKRIHPCLYQISTITEKKGQQVPKGQQNVQNLNLFEMIDAGMDMMFQITFNYDLLKAVMKDWEWKSINEKIRMAFGIELKDLIEMGNKAEGYIVGKCLEALQKHGEMVLQHDLEWASHHFGENSPVSHIMKKLKGEGGFKIGYASGFHAMTYYFLRNYPETADDFWEIFNKVISKKKLDYPINKRRDLPDDREIAERIVSLFPSSRRFVTDKKDEVLSPVGWVKPVVLD